MNLNKLNIQDNCLSFNGDKYGIKKVKSYQVCPGVDCTEYKIKRDKTKDLAVVNIMPGCSTPLQLVKEGDLTVESSIVGNGCLYVRKANGGTNIYEFTGNQYVQTELGLKAQSTSFSALVEIGDVIQWRANPNSTLVFMEICTPPYKDGRFENITETDERFFSFIEA
ncbi:MAG: hypothetical protein ABIM99_01205 [Candidatus Dojkabacteria bacterium]